MPENVTETEARLALSSIERRREQIVAEINVPAWYWPGLAVAWVGLGCSRRHRASLGNDSSDGAVRSGARRHRPRVMSGRQGSPTVSIRIDVVSHRIPLLIIGFLMVMTVATVGAALIFNADGARHPVPWRELSSLPSSLAADLR